MRAARKSVPPVRQEHLVCPNCGAGYDVDANLLGREGRNLRCPNCREVWFDAVAASEADAIGGNPVLGPEFPRKLKRYLNGLPKPVKQNSTRSTHAIKTFLMREGLAVGAVGHAASIKVNLPHFRSAEFMWDAVGKV